MPVVGHQAVSTSNRGSADGLRVSMLAATVGAIVGLIAATYSYDRIVPPPRCQPKTRRIVTLNCISTGPPAWALAIGLSLGIAIALAGLWFFRFKRPHHGVVEP